MALNDKELYFDNSDRDDGHITIVDEDSITNKVHGEQINNTFQQQINVTHGVTGSIFEEDGIVYYRSTYMESTTTHHITSTETQTSQEPY